MTQDWTAVAATIKEHMIRLGLNQDQLAKRSGVAKSIVRELLHNTTQRSRHGRTLEAVSIGLGLPPRHLHAVAIDQPPPSIPRSSRPKTANVPRELTMIRNHMNELATQMTAIDAKLTTLICSTSPPHHENQAQPRIPGFPVHPVAFREVRLSEGQGSAG